ncbi:MAG: o-succinylbenzoate--CoA ligase, partial [Anaerolineae bacterium]
MMMEHAATPDRTALLAGGERFTAGDLWSDVLVDMAWLHTAGVAPGDRVAVWLPSGVAYVRMVFAMARMGVTLVALNTRLTAEEAANQVAASGAKAVVHAGDLPEGFSTQARLLDRRDALPVNTAKRIEMLPFDLNRTQAIMFSSGTTGRPKAIPITFGQHMHSAMASAWRVGVLPDDHWLACMPLYHVGGQAILFRAVLYGIAVNLHPRFDVEAVSRAIDEEGVTLVSLVPTMLHRLLDYRADRAFPPSLRLVLLGGAKAPAALIERAAVVGLPVAATYGLTEACSQVATATPAQVRAKPGTVGRPLVGTQVRIVDEHGADRKPGEVGEIAVQGPTVFGGYLDNPQATARPLRAGWLHTGDLGYLDSAGDLWVVTRRTDLIVSGGENIYPAEVEAVLAAHPGVEAAVRELRTRWR